MVDNAAPGPATPSWTPEERAGLKDFWEVYTRHYDTMNAETMRVALQLPEFAQVLRDIPPERLKDQQARSYQQMRDALLDDAWEPYLKETAEQGAFYAHAGVGFAGWFKIIDVFNQFLTPRLFEAFGQDPERLRRALDAMARFVSQAMSTIGDAYLQAKEHIITQQHAAIRELSTPVLSIRERLLLLPIIGVLDTMRARQLTEQLLFAIRNHRARAVVMDITGVPNVDTGVANHLLQTVQAAKLMGAMVFVTGLSPEIAQTLVRLGVDLSRISTIGDLQGGIEEAERALGLRAHGGGA